MLNSAGIRSRFVWFHVTVSTILPGAFVLLGAGCGEQRKIESEEAVIVPVDQKLTALSRYLAGKATAGDSFPTEEPGYIQHSQRMDLLWQKIQQKHVAAINTWRADHFPTATVEQVLYFFSGVDWLNLFLWFPDAKRYIMVSLEEPGAVPDPTQLNPLERSLALHRLYAAIATFGDYNYLMTRTMRSQLAGNAFRGVKGAILMQMGLQNQQILGMERVQLHANGQFEPAPQESRYLDPFYLQAAQRQPGHKPDALRILFRPPGAPEEQVRELIFLRLWISDDLFQSETATAAFLENQADFCYMLKSASYFLHRPQSEKLARYLASRAKCAIQDDSGVPYRYFNPEQTEVSLHGFYVAATPLADQPFHPSQQDLRLAYSQATRPPLPFQYGYGGLAGGRSNLQVVRKKAEHHKSGGREQPETNPVR